MTEDTKTKKDLPQQDLITIDHLVVEADSYLFTMGESFRGQTWALWMGMSDLPLGLKLNYMGHTFVVKESDPDDLYLDGKTHTIISKSGKLLLRRKEEYVKSLYVCIECGTITGASDDVCKKCGSTMTRMSDDAWRNLNEALEILRNLKPNLGDKNRLEDVVSKLEEIVNE